jgi:hypothetical protein
VLGAPACLCRAPRGPELPPEASSAHRSRVPWAAARRACPGRRSRRAERANPVHARARLHPEPADGRRASGQPSSPGALHQLAPALTHRTPPDPTRPIGLRRLQNEIRTPHPHDAWPLPVAKAVAVSDVVASDPGLSPPVPRHWVPEPPVSAPGRPEVCRFLPARSDATSITTLITT